jgi:hypothetical protein
VLHNPLFIPMNKFMGFQQQSPDGLEAGACSARRTGVATGQCSQSASEADFVTPSRGIYSGAKTGQLWPMSAASILPITGAGSAS